jgi:hypothetical protein
MDITKMAQLYWAASDAEIVAMKAREAREAYFKEISPALVRRVEQIAGDIICEGEYRIAHVKTRIRWPHRLEVVADCHYRLKTGEYSKKASRIVILHSIDLFALMHPRETEVIV